MAEVKIKLDSLDNINAFVAAAQKKNYDIDLLQGKYLVNAKSIMGVFSLDLTKPVTVRLDTDDTEFTDVINKYIITE